MARRRYISTDISTDSKLAKVSDFAALLYTWMIPHTGDDCRLTAKNAEELLYTVVPNRKKTVKQVEAAIKEVVDIGLVDQDENGYFCLPSESFYKYQTYINAAKRRETPRNAASSSLSSSLSPPSSFPSPLHPPLKEEGEDTPLPPQGGESDQKLLTVKAIEQEALSAKQFVELYHVKAPHLPAVRELTKERERKIKLRLSKKPQREFWSEVFSKADATNFLRGSGPTGWKATLDFFIANDTNAVKVVEGKYDNRVEEKTVFRKIANLELK